MSTATVMMKTKRKHRTKTNQRGLQARKVRKASLRRREDDLKSQFAKGAVYYEENIESLK